MTIWTAQQTTNGFGLFMDGALVADGYDMATADRKAHEANTAEIAAARLAKSETRQFRDPR
jgi:hypothetical protein